MGIQLSIFGDSEEATQAIYICKNEDCYRHTEEAVERFAAEASASSSAQGTQSPPDLCLSHVIDVLETEIKKYQFSYSDVRRCWWTGHPANHGLVFREMRRRHRLGPLRTIMFSVLGLEDLTALQREQRLRLFVKVCQRRECYGAALYTAVLTDSLHKVEHLLPQMDLDMSRRVLIFCTEYFSFHAELSVTPGAARSSQVWSSVLKVLDRHPEWGSEILNNLILGKFFEHRDIRYIHLFLSKEKFNPNSLRRMRSVMTWIVARNEGELLDQYIDVIEECCDLFHREPCLWLHVIKELFTPRQIEHLQGSSGVSYRSTFEKFLRFVLPTTRWQTDGQFRIEVDDLARVTVQMMTLLYRSGVLTQAQVTRLNSHNTGQMSRHDDTAAASRSSFLRLAASTPRRLQDWCALTVSAHLNAKSVKDRAARAQALELPKHLINEILFKDIIQDFLADL